MYFFFFFFFFFFAEADKAESVQVETAMGCVKVREQHVISIMKYIGIFPFQPPEMKTPLY